MYSHGLSYRNTYFVPRSWNENGTRVPSSLEQERYSRSPFLRTKLERSTLSCDTRKCCILDASECITDSVHLNMFVMKNPSGCFLECQRVWTVENVAFWTHPDAYSYVSDKRVRNHENGYMGYSSISIGIGCYCGSGN